jgi:hypothetical protein
MATEKQKKAARQNIKKAQKRWKEMTSGQHARSQPEGRQRRKPGTTGEGGYYHVQLRPKKEFETFRTQDVGDKGHIQRVAGRRENGTWATVTWLISKDDAHISGGRLVGDTKEAKDLLDKLDSAPIHKTGDRFSAKDRRNVPEKDKPTPAQKKARSANIKKAQAARRKD